MGFSKKAIALGFNWIFAIIVGVLIILLAIYGAVKFAGTSERVAATEDAAKFVAVLEQMSVSGTGKSSEIKLGNEIKIYLDCSSLDNRPFGEQDVSFSEKKRGKFGEEGNEIAIKNKYVFGDEVEGKNLYLFSKPFSLSYKTGDLIIISSGNYCFYKTPSAVLDLIEGLNTGIKFAENLEECSENSVKVCFAGENCDVVVSSSNDFKSGKIVKDGFEMFYVDNLIFAGIFSSPEIYECNVKRLKARFDQLAFVYGEKIRILEDKGCRSRIGVALNNMKNIGVESSSDLIELIEDGERLNLLNIEQPDGCEVW